MKHIEKIKNKGKKKKHVERIFKQLYQDKMSNVVPLINKTKNLYDLLMILFPDGYKTQIAANESLVNTMGLPLLPIQSNLLKLLKCIFPPNRDVYMIKNDCLSYIKIDEGRTKLVKQVQKEIRDSNKYIKIFTSNPDEYCESKQGILLRISQKDDKLSQYLGHINNYQSKLENGEFDDFTNERLNNILTLYQSLNEFLLKDCSIPETD
jgi:Na+/phosphate symporter